MFFAKNYVLLPNFAKRKARKLGKGNDTIFSPSNFRSHTTPTRTCSTMALPATTLAEYANWAVDLPSEVWALVARK
jgi:hypothetical protein